MSAEVMGSISGGMVMASGLFYITRTYQRKAQPNFVSFALWSILGLALLLTYGSSGARWNVLPAVMGFVNPCIIFIIVAARRKTELRKLSSVEWLCLACVIISLVMWGIMRRNPTLAQYALYIAICADWFAAIPTFQFVWAEPHGDRPLAWLLFAFGFGLAIFAVPARTFANYALPGSSFILGVVIAFPLCRYRWENRLSAREWF